MILIEENYRGFDLYFRKDEDLFTATHEYNEKQLTSKSFKGLKKAVDSFVKDNFKFNPLVVFEVSRWGIPELQNKLTLEGVRKDKKFVYRDAKDRVYSLRLDDEKNYVLYEPKIDEHLQLIKSKKEVVRTLNKEIDKLNEEFVSKLTRLDVYSKKVGLKEGI